MHTNVTPYRVRLYFHASSFNSHHINTYRLYIFKMDAAPSSAMGALKLGSSKKPKEPSPSPWGESDFTNDSSMPSASSYNWDQADVNQDDFFNSVISDKSSKVSNDYKM